MVVIDWTSYLVKAAVIWFMKSSANIVCHKGVMTYKCLLTDSTMAVTHWVFGPSLFLSLKKLRYLFHSLKKNILPFTMFRFKAFLLLSFLILGSAIGVVAQSEPVIGVQSGINRATGEVPVRKNINDLAAEGSGPCSQQTAQWYLGTISRSGRTGYWYAAGTCTYRPCGLCKTWAMQTLCLTFS